MIASDQIDRVDLQLQTEGFGGQLHRSSRRAQLGGVQLDLTHVDSTNDEFALTIAGFEIC